MGHVGKTKRCRIINVSNKILCAFGTQWKCTSYRWFAPACRSVSTVSVWEKIVRKERQERREKRGSQGRGRERGVLTVPRIQVCQWHHKPWPNMSQEPFPCRLLNQKTTKGKSLKQMKWASSSLLIIHCFGYSLVHGNLTAKDEIARQSSNLHRLITAVKLALRVFLLYISSPAPRLVVTRSFPLNLHAYLPTVVCQLWTLSTMLLISRVERCPPLATPLAVLYTPHASVLPYGVGAVHKLKNCRPSFNCPLT